MAAAMLEAVLEAEVVAALEDEAVPLAAALLGSPSVSRTKDEGKGEQRVAAGEALEAERRRDWMRPAAPPAPASSASSG